MTELLGQTLVSEWPTVVTSVALNPTKFGARSLGAPFKPEPCVKHGARGRPGRAPGLQNE